MMVQDHTGVSETSRTCSLSLALPSEETGDQEKGPKTVVLDRQTIKVVVSFRDDEINVLNATGTGRYLRGNLARLLCLLMPFYMVNTPKETSQTEVSAGEDTENSHCSGTGWRGQRPPPSTSGGIWTGDPRTAGRCLQPAIPVSCREQEQKDKNKKTSPQKTGPGTAEALRIRVCNLRARCIGRACSSQQTQTRSHLTY